MNEIGFEHFSIQLIEDYPCESRIELYKRESHWIDLLQPTLNSVKPWISDQERKLKEKIYKAKHKAEHKEKHKEDRAKYYAKNKDKTLTGHSE